MYSQLKNIISQFKGKKILIVGDVMIDAYYIGKVTRISPEAPVPIVNLTQKEDRLGGAGNVALNIQELGGEAILCSAIGNDEAGTRLEKLLDQKGLTTEGLQPFPSRKTTIKSRIIGNHQQLMRLDEEITHNLSDDEESSMISHILTILENESIDGIIFEDYNKGVLTPKLIQKIVSWANDHDIPTTVDPKINHFFEYQKVTIFKPNLKELRDGLKRDVSPTNQNDFLEAVQNLESRLCNEMTLVTLSEHGIFVKNKAQHHFIAAHPRNITDVSGAGDTVIAVATLAKVSNANAEEIATLSNLAGGLACEKPGVVPISANQLIVELDKLIA